MSDTTQHRTPTPSPRRLDELDEADLGRRLWSLWRQGQQPRVEEFLEKDGVCDPEEIVVALRVDQAERRRLGQWVATEVYLDAFPAVRDHAASAIDLIFAEFLLREELGERPTLEEFLRRFPQHAGELRLQIELHRELGADRPRTATRDGSAATPPAAGDRTAAGALAAHPEVRGPEVPDVPGGGSMELVDRARQAERDRRLIRSSRPAERGETETDHDRVREELAQLPRKPRPSWPTSGPTTSSRHQRR